MEGKLPNFFVIGAAKSGTTSLHDYLSQHPEIYMSPVKEPHFFSFMDIRPRFSGPYEQSNSVILGDRLKREKYGFAITTWAEYRKLFSGVRSHRAIGESSVSYLYFAQAAAQRIRHHVPGARLIAVLRNPVDRAYSKYLQFRRDGAEPLSRFEDALTAEKSRMAENWSPTWFYLEWGFYFGQLRDYYRMFNRSQIHIALYENFAGNSADVLRDIFLFLEVDSEFLVDLTRQQNVSRDGRLPRNLLLHDLAARPNWLSDAAKKTLPPGVISFMRPRVRSAVTRKGDHAEVSPLSPETRQRLTAVFRDDVLRLQDLIKKDLSAWL